MYSLEYDEDKCDLVFQYQYITIAYLSIFRGIGTIYYFNVP